MTDSTLEAVLRRDRLVVTGALAIIIALAWGYVLWLANDMDMGGMDMTGFRMIPAGIGIMLPASTPWTAIEFAYVFAMWAVMMVGMMAPSAAPMILMYARVGRQGKAEGKPFAATGWFAAGYFLAWTGFSLAATFVQWVFERAALLDSRMASASTVLGGIVLIVAGVYQWTPLKDVCLVQCQTPLQFLMRCAVLSAAGAPTRRLLRRLLLGSDGAFVRGRSDECALDCASRAAGPFGEACAHWAVDRARRRRCLCRRRCLDVVIFDAVMSRPLKPVWIPVAAAVSGTQD
jgi:predicted metal-binding membrane protein